MKKTLKKCLAIILTIITVISSCSVMMSVFAEELRLNDAETIESSETEHETAPEIVSEVTEERTEYTKTFIMSDGSFIRTLYSQPIHFKSNNYWVDCDNTLKESENGEIYTTSSRKASVSLSSKAAEGRTVFIEGDNYNISWGYNDVKSSKLRVNNKNINKNGDEKFTMLDNITQSAEYKNVYPHVDLEYTISSNSIKENLVLNNKNAASEYQISYYIDTLTAIQTDSKTIELKSGNDIIYTISAPVMYDSNGVESDNINLSILSVKNGVLTVGLSIDSDWLKDKTRAYPVVVDPVIMEDSKKSIDATYVLSSEPNDSHDSSENLNVSGVTNSVSYALLDTSNISSSNIAMHVVSAKMHIPVLSSSNQSMVISAYEITGQWDSSVTWNTKPTFSSSVLDYSTAVSNQTVELDITKLFNNGAENNNGILLKANSAASATLSKSGGENPIFTMQYIMTTGIDDSFSYTQFDMGSAGDVYINTLNGNLIVSDDVMSTMGETFPFDVNLTYNSFGADGYTWMSSFNSGFKELSVFIDNDGSYCWFNFGETNDDGTVSIINSEECGWTRLKVTEIKYVEFPLPFGKTLKIPIPIAFDAWKDDENITYSYDLTGIKEITEKSADNTLTYLLKREYNEADGSYTYTDKEGSYIKYIENDSGMHMTQYDADNIAHDVVEYIYDANGNVTQIKRNNEVKAEFAYDSNSRMTKITNDSGRSLNLTYDNGEMPAVIGVQEAEGTTLGQKTTYEHTHNTATVRTAGVDCVHGNSDDVLTINTFDDYARLVCTKTTTVAEKDLGAVSFDYEKGSGSSNTISSKISRASAVGKAATNYVKNHNIESLTNWTKKTIDDSNCKYTAAYSTDKAYVGNGSLKITVSDVTKTGGAGVYQTFYMSDGIIKAGKQYSASAYINTSGIKRDSDASTTRNHGAALMIKATLADGSTTRSYTESVQKTDPNVNNGWERVFVNYTVPADATRIALYLLVRNGSGTAYFDAVQLEEGSIQSQYNMLENNSFIYTDSNNYAADWSRYLVNANDKVENSKMKIVGDISTNKAVLQEVGLKNAKQSDTYICSVVAGADSVPIKSGRRFGYHVLVFYYDSAGNSVSRVKSIVNFCDDITTDQYLMSSFDLTDTDETLVPYKLRLVLTYYKNANKAYYDTASLIKSNDIYDLNSQSDDSGENTPEENDPYTYNENGDILTYTDENNNIYYYTYDSMGNLTSTLTSNNVGDRYEYYYYDSDNDGINDKSVSKKDICEDGTITTYVYDSDWHLVSENVTDGDVILTETTYDSNGNISTYTDESGTKTYTYDTNGNLLSALDESGNGNSYVYDSKGNVTQDTTTDNGSTLVHNYDSDGKITSVLHNGFTYNYTYDAFGNAKTVKIGNQPLVTYAYRANNGTLSSLTYGNGSKESYNYNEYGEPTKKTLSGLGNYTWIYDSQGKIIYSKDTVNSQKTYYKYDDEKRYVGEKVYSTVNSNAYANFLYSDMNVLDDEGRVIKNTTTSNGLSVSTPFTYSADGKTTTSAMTNIRTVTTNYNDDGQIINRSISTDTPIAETFSYKDDDAVATHKVNNDEYSYTYDDSGNITEIKKNNVLKQSYVYDSKNQLVRDNNLDTNKTTVYTYDNGGNISNKKEYAYTTGDVGTATSTKTYTYDATWKDKLTNFNGQEISYDAIGNPTTYRGATTTWFGRQMQSYSKGSTNVTYKYDENGLRTSKIVNGVQYDYYYVGDKLIYEKKGDEYDLFYRYDADGRLALVEKRRLSDNYRWYYYIVTNSRGDVLEIHNGPGELTAKYTYDAWGKLISVKNASGAALSTNSFAYEISVRYRGYVYDSETGLYYLQSRYYDPETGRFLNADDVNFIGFGGNDIAYNAFSYCGNNAVNYIDPFGAEDILAVPRKAISIMTTVLMLLGFISAAGASASTANPVGLAVGAGILVVGIAGIAIWNGYANSKEPEQLVLSKRTKIPTKLKEGDKLKTPDTAPGEFSKNKKGVYTHNKTKWQFKIDKSRHRGRHWDVSPKNGKQGDYYNIDLKGNILS